MIPKQQISMASWTVAGARIRLLRLTGMGSCRTQRWEGSRPRDPPFPKHRAFPIQGRKYTVGFENAFEARGDARPPCQGSRGRGDRSI
jgi:hypothetical protein